MATYKQIQDYVKARYGITVKTCWIAHVKEICGLKPKVANNRYSLNERKYPCPNDKVEYIKEAFKHFKMI